MNVVLHREFEGIAIDSKESRSAFCSDYYSADPKEEKALFKDMGPQVFFDIRFGYDSNIID